MVSDAKLRVLIAHNEPLLAAGLEAALRREADFEVLTIAQASLDEIPKRPIEQVDVILSDCETGLDFAMSARSNRSRPTGRSVVIVTQDDSEVSIRRAMEAGVKGYLLQSATTRDCVVQAVRAAARGGITLDPIAATRIANSLTADSLTFRELEVLRLVMLGLTNKVIAARLGIGLGTAKCHVKQLLMKLQANTRTQAVAIAQRRGLVSLAAPDSAPERGAQHAPSGVHRYSRRSYLNKLATATSTVR